MKIFGRKLNTFIIFSAIILASFVLTGCLQNNIDFNKEGNGFHRAAALNQSRYYHTATLLPDGNVLIAGGDSSKIGVLDSAELYLTKKNKFVMTGRMNVGRSNHLALLLKNGKVLLLGGNTKGINTSTDTVEEYDYKTGQFKIVGYLLQKRSNPQGVLLDDGRIFVYSLTKNKGGYAEIYDPVNNTSKYTSQMNFARSDFSLVKLKDGNILLIGGNLSSLTDGKFNHILPMTSKNPEEPLIKSTKTFEIYNASKNKYKLLNSMENSRAGALSLLLPSNNILIIGGVGYNPNKKLNFQVYQNNFDEKVKSSYRYKNLDNSVQEIEVFNPTTQKSKVVGNLEYALNPQNANLINNKYLLLTGGNGKSEEVINLSTFKTVETPEMNVKRGGHTATNLSQNKVLITGGNWFGTEKTRTSEIFVFNNN